MKNVCVKCGETWQVDEEFAQLDAIDMENIKNYGHLISICEDCDPDGECVAVLMPLERK